MEGEEEKVMDISLKDLSKKLEEFAKARDWEKYHSPRNLLLAMVRNNVFFCCSYFWRPFIKSFHIDIFACF